MLGMAFLLLILIYYYQNQAQRADKLGDEMNVSCLFPLVLMD